MSTGSLSAAAFSSTTDDGNPLLHELASAVADVTAISIQDRKDQTLLGQLFQSFLSFSALSFYHLNCCQNLTSFWWKC